MAKKTQTGTAATVLLVKAQVAHTLHAYEHDTTAHDRGLSYGLEAAAALGIDPGRVFKTIIIQADSRLAVAVVPVERQVDLKALAGALGAKRVTLAPAADAERATGYVLGGISPLGQRRTLATVLDASATGRPTILVSAGRRGLDVELDPQDLITLTGASCAEISR